MLTVKGSAVEMLECMLEQTSHQTSVVVDGVLSSLDRSALLKTMVYFHEMLSNPLVKTVQMDDDAGRGMFRAYHTHVILEDNSNEEEKRGTAVVRLKVCEVHIQIVASLCMPFNSQQLTSVFRQFCSLFCHLFSLSYIRCTSVTLHVFISYSDLTVTTAQSNLMKYCETQTRSVEITYGQEDPIVTKVYFPNTMDVRNFDFKLFSLQILCICYSCEKKSLRR